MTSPLSLLASVAAPESAPAPDPVADPALFGAALLAAMQPMIQPGNPLQPKLPVLPAARSPDGDENTDAPGEGPGTAEPATKHEGAHVAVTATPIKAIIPETLGELLAPAVRVARRVRDEPVALTRDRQVDRTTAVGEASDLAPSATPPLNGAAPNETQSPAPVQPAWPEAVVTPVVVAADSATAKPAIAAQRPQPAQGGSDDAAGTSDPPALSQGNNSPVAALPVSRQDTTESRATLPAAPDASAAAGATAPGGEPSMATPVTSAPAQVTVATTGHPDAATNSAPAARRPVPASGSRIQAKAPEAGEVRQPAAISSGTPAAAAVPSGTTTAAEVSSGTTTAAAVPSRTPTTAADAPHPGKHGPRRERLHEPLHRLDPAPTDDMWPHDVPMALQNPIPPAVPSAASRGDESRSQPAGGTETANSAPAAALIASVVAAGGMPHRALTADIPVAQRARENTPLPRPIQDEPAIESTDQHLSTRPAGDSRQGSSIVIDPRGSLASAFAHALAALLSEGEIAEVRVVRGRPESGGDKKESSVGTSGRTPLPPTIAGVTTAEDGSRPTRGSTPVPPAGTESPKERGTRGTQPSVADAEGDTAVLKQGTDPMRRTPLAAVTPSRVAPLPSPLPAASRAGSEPQAPPVQRKLPSDRQELPPDLKASANDSETRKREPVAAGDTPSDTHANSSSSLGGQTERNGEPATRPREASPGEARNLPSRDRNRDVPAGLADRVTLQLTDADGRPTRIRVAVLGEQVRAVILPPDNETGRQLEHRMDDLHAALVRQGFVDPRVSVQQSAAPEAVAGWVPPGRTDVPVPRGAEQPAGDQRQGSGRREQQQHGEQQRHPQGRSRNRDPEPRERESAS